MMNLKSIPEYEGLYSITPEGRVWSHRQSKWMKSRPDKYGYIRIGLTKDKQQKMFFIHQLVALTFISNPNGYVEVNHKDEDKTNNHVSNLEWCSHIYNVNYGTRTQRMMETRSLDGYSSVPVYCVELDKVFPSQKEASRATQTAQSDISRTLNGKRKTAGGYHWKYVL